MDKMTEIDKLINASLNLKDKYDAQCKLLHSQQQQIEQLQRENADLKATIRGMNRKKGWDTNDY